MSSVTENWMRLVRANFLLLTVVIVLAGLTASLYENHSFNPINATLCCVGAILAHMAVNVLNNFFDYKRGVDQRTVKTPFSGGVDVLVEGKITPSSALLTGVLCLIGALIVGIYFLIMFLWPLLPMVVFGAVSICLYTPYLSRLPGLSEPVAGINFGFIALGAYATQSGSLGISALAVFVPVTILVSLLLFLNEFPDMEADKLAGRRHWVILLGKKRSVKLYTILLTVMYTSIVASTLLKFIPVTSLLAIVTVPLAYKAASVASEKYEDLGAFIHALDMNVLIVLMTISLLAIGLFIGAMLKT